MRIAHFSDPHVLVLEGVPRWRLLTNKRLTGYANILLKRGREHRFEVVEALARDLAGMKIDHVVVTGDVSNLALDTEFEAFRVLLDKELGIPSEEVSLIPGNHDRYTRGSLRAARFEKHLGTFLRSDPPFFARALDAGVFPVVKLRGPVAFIGLCTAVPRIPFVAAGEIGKTQLQALKAILASPEVKSRLLVLLTHHPVAEPMKPLHAWLEGLRDAHDLLEALAGCARGLLLHGHLHRRLLRIIPTRAGELWSIGASSASLVRDAQVRRAGYNLYDIASDGRVDRVVARVLDKKTMSFGDAPVPLVRASEC